MLVKLLETNRLKVWRWRKTRRQTTLRELDSELLPTRHLRSESNISGDIDNQDMARRKRDEVEEDIDTTPRKSRRKTQDDSPTAKGTTTPANRKSILRGTPSKANGTPSSLRKVLFSLDKNTEDGGEDEETPTAVRNDRSARRKISRALNREQANDSEDEEDEGEAALANAILEDGDEIGSDDETENVVAAVSEDITAVAPDTPSKRGRGRPRGRPRKERTPSPPLDMPPHELYFFQNRTGANKTSSNTLPANTLLNHEDYLSNIKSYRDPHEHDLQRLKKLHHRAFDQWIFELEQGMNICLYGYGSKRDLAMEFADHLYHTSTKSPNIVVVNGYTPGLTIRDVLTTLATAILPKSTKLPGQPLALLDLLLAHLPSHPPTAPTTLIIHSLDAPPLRRSHSTLARLAAHPCISLLATVDTPNFPLLWDSTLLRQFNWVYHDTTTFSPYRVELDIIEDVNALLGKSGRGVKGREGVAFVLKSLPENARSLFRILVVEQLMGMAEGDTGISTHGAGMGGDADDDSILGDSDEEAAAAETPSKKRGRGRPPKKDGTPKKKKVVAVVGSGAAAEGVEYRTLYHKAVEEFVCSSELNFRTLLKEFHDHQMVESRKDGLGVERLYVPGMGREELEGVLEEVV